MDEARLHSVAEELNIPHIYTDFAAMCADPELDGVVIVSPSFLHVEQIRIAMEHGKHVFCEKPLGIDVAQCKEAEKVVEAHPELVFQLGFMRRFDPSYAEAKRRVDAGEIGKVVLVRSYTQDPPQHHRVHAEIRPPLRRSVPGHVCPRPGPGTLVHWLRHPECLGHRRRV